MAESSIFIPTWWKLVLVFHLRTGYFTGEYPKVFNMRYERFFLDGMDSVRGYRFIAPPGDYQALGGNKMALLNVEYRFPIKDMLSGLIFFDAGQTWADNEWPWARFQPKKSVGIGVRIDLLGALARFEWGYPLDEGEEERFRFDIGPAF
jgi:outer membrane protein insertion porin family